MSIPKYYHSSGKVVYGRLLSYVKPYSFAFVFALIGMLMVAATETGFVAIMKPLLDGSFVERDSEVTQWVPLAIIAIFIVRGIGSFAVRYCMAWVGRNVVRDLRKEMYNHFIYLPNSFYDKNASGKLISKVIYDVEQVSNASSSAIKVLVQDTLTLLGLLGWMFYLQWQLTLIFITVGPVLSIIVVRANKRQRKISRRVQHSVGDVAHIAQESIDAQQELKIFGGHEYESEAFYKAIENNRQQNMKAVTTIAIAAPFVQVIASCFLAAIVYYSTRPEMIEQITVGAFMSFIAAALLLLSPIKRLTAINAVLQRGIAAAESIFDLLIEELEVDEGRHKLEQVKGNVRFEQVGFRYNDEKGDVLKDINLDIQAGTSVALVGKSGSGKTTLVDLIPRFYDVGQGRILLDGHDIRDLELKELRKHIALVSQDITLFNDTIAHNIAYGRLGEASEAQIREAAKAAHAIEFIDKLPNGMDTIVGERGVMLSGGQRQRLAIARAILKDAPILILDEATSALDTESERYIQSALKALMRNRTTFVIAHRLSTIENVDRIVVLDASKLVESGSHDELLHRGGYYSTLHRLQFSEEHA